MNYLFVAFQEIKTGLGTGHVSRVNRILNFLDDGFYVNNSVKFLSNSKPPNTKKYNSISCETIKQGKEIIIELIKRKDDELRKKDLQLIQKDDDLRLKEKDQKNKEKDQLNNQESLKDKNDQLK